MKLLHRGSDIEIVRKWFEWGIVFWTAWAVAVGWAAFSFYPTVSENPVSEEGLVFLFFVVMGVCVAYYAAAGWLNRTHIVVSRDKITVRHEPVPWLGNFEMKVSNVKELYTKEQSHTYRRNFFTRTTYTYDVDVATRAGRTVKLAHDLKKPEQADFIVQQIERYLGIEDVPVEGDT